MSVSHAQYALVRPSNRGSARLGRACSASSPNDGCRGAAQLSEVGSGQPGSFGPKHLGRLPLLSWIRRDVTLSLWTSSQCEFHVLLSPSLAGSEHQGTMNKLQRTLVAGRRMAMLSQPILFPSPVSVDHDEFP